MKRTLTRSILVALTALTFLASVSVAQNCPAPANLTAGGATTSSIQLNWTVPAGVLYFQVQYRPAGSATWSQAIAQAVPFQLNNLTCGGVYEWQVRSVCGSSGVITHSAYTPGGVFTILPCNTSCLAPTALTTTNIGVNQASLSWIQIPGVTVYNLRYKLISGANWTIISNASSPYQLSNLACNHHYEWQVQSVCVTTQGTTTLSPWSASATFLTASCPGSCPAPTGLQTTQITTTSALASWTAVAGAPSYTVRYRPAGSLAWIYVFSATTSKTLSNLNCNTPYQWQVRANCAPLSNSQINTFSATATFTTLTCPSTCPTPSGLTVTNVTATSAQLAWNSTGVNSYNVRYQAAGGTPVTQVVSGTVTTITGLIPATIYTWQVQSICSSGGNVVSPWSALHTFITLSQNSGCGVPSGLAATATSSTSAQLIWNAVTGALSYNIRYKHANALNWNSTTSSTNSKSISGLTAGMVYEWQVQSVCAGTNGVIVNSAWSGSSYFTTPLLLTVHPNPAGHTATVTFESRSAGEAHLEILNLSGTTVYSMPLTLSPGVNTIPLEVSFLKEGMYSLRITSGTDIATSGMLIRR